MNKQRKVLITITYNEMGIIIDTKAEEVAQPQTIEQKSALQNSIPLPKHGRLIDADAYIDKYEECGWLDDISVDEFNKITPTIIPATEGGDGE